MKKWLLLPVLLSAGCMKVTVTHQDYEYRKDDKVWVHGFLWGIIGGKVDAKSVCGNLPVAKVETYQGAANGFALWFTGGVYTPMTAHVYCGPKSKPEAQE